MWFYKYQQICFCLLKAFPTLFFHNWRSANFFNLETVQVCHIPSVERSEIRFIFFAISCLSKLVFKNYCKQFFCFISFHFLYIYVSCLCIYKYILLLYIFVKISNLRRKTNWIFWKFVKDYFGGNHKRVYNGTKFQNKKMRMAEEVKILTKILIRFWHSSFVCLAGPSLLIWLAFQLVCHAIA